MQTLDVEMNELFSPAGPAIFISFTRPFLHKFVLFMLVLGDIRHYTTTACCYQAIPGNDQNASPTNQKTAGSKLDRTS